MGPGGFGSGCFLPLRQHQRENFSDYLLILPVKAWWGLLRKNLPRVWETFVPVAPVVSCSSACPC